MSRKYSQEKLGQQVKYYREKNNFTQKELAKIVGNISPQYISDIENGIGSTISFDKLQRIAIALNTNLDMLLVDSLVKYENPMSDNPLFLKISEEVKECENLILLKYFENIFSAFFD